MDKSFNFKQVIDLLHDKSVAIVGNAPRILDQHHGKEIDKHDVVIRMNRGYPDTNYDALGHKTTFASCWGPGCDPDRFVGKRWYFILNDTKDNPLYGADPEKVTKVLYNREMGVSLVNTINNASSGCIWAVVSIFAKAKVIDCYGRDHTTMHNFSDIGTDKTSYFHHNFKNEEECIIDYAKKENVRLNMIFD